MSLREGDSFFKRAVSNIFGGVAPSGKKGMSKSVSEKHKKKSVKKKFRPKKVVHKKKRKVEGVVKKKSVKRKSYVKGGVRKKNSAVGISRIQLKKEMSLDKKKQKPIKVKASRSQLKKEMSLDKKKQKPIKVKASRSQLKKEMSLDKKKQKPIKVKVLKKKIKKKTDSGKMNKKITKIKVLKSQLKKEMSLDKKKQKLVVSKTGHKHNLNKSHLVKQVENVKKGGKEDKRGSVKSDAKKGISTNPTLKVSQEELDIYVKELQSIKDEVARVVVGHDEVVHGILRGILANGHVVIEGVPGVAKTLLIRSLSEASGCAFSRIQFTVDLLPTDITGVTTYDEHKREFITVKGPIFANFIIGDEINRAPPKTQSAMLEAMQEKQVTIGKETHALPSPFFIMANNNPLESSGTYPLPEAQVDRFLFKLKMGYTSTEHEEKIIDQNISLRKFEEYQIKPIVSPEKIEKMQAATRDIMSSPKIKRYVVQIVNATRKPKDYDIKLGKYIEWGCSPRASIGLTIAAKADALLNGKGYITPKNIKNIAHDVLRHRIILNYQGQAENISTDDIIDEILTKVS